MRMSRVCIRMHAPQGGEALRDWSCPALCCAAHALRCAVPPLRTSTGVPSRPTMMSPMIHAPVKGSRVVGFRPALSAGEPLGTCGTEANRRVGPPPHHERLCLYGSLLAARLVQVRRGPSGAYIHHHGSPSGAYVHHLHHHGSSFDRCPATVSRGALPAHSRHTVCGRTARPEALYALSSDARTS